MRLRKFLVLCCMVIALTGCSKEQTVDTKVPVLENPGEREVHSSEVLGEDDKKQYIIISTNNESTLVNEGYLGRFYIRLFNDQGEQEDMITLNPEEDIAIASDFKLIYKDYNNDGIMDFNIGYAKDNQWFYRFYSIKDNTIEPIIFLNYLWLPSNFSGTSIEFKEVDGQLYNYYKIDDRYVYEKYYWNDGGYFDIADELFLDSAFSNSDINVIEDKFIQLKDEINLQMTDKEIVDRDSKALSYMINNVEIIDYYRFIKGPCEYEDYFTFIKDMYQDKGLYLNIFLNEFGLNKRISDMSLKEFKAVAAELYFGDNKENPAITVTNEKWKGEEEYDIMYGIAHQNKFFLIYDKGGNYLDGFIWSDNIADTPKIRYIEKLNAYEILPVCFDRGTATSIYGSKILQVYNRNLINIFSYPSSIELLALGKYNDLHIEMESIEHDEDSGDIHIKYHVDMIDKDKCVQKGVNVKAKWNGNRFDLPFNSIYDFIEDNIIN